MAGASETTGNRIGVTSTYRLQLRAEFTLDDARSVADYLQQLGVSHVYLSPILTASEGSTHGYDVTDPTTVSAALGGIEALRALSAELRTRGMGLVVDIVPNHVGVADPRQNAWWWDVLKFGRDSQFAGFFDIDWGESNGVGGRIALPVLGSDNDPAAVRIDKSGAEPMLALHDLRFPIAPDTGDGNALAVLDRQYYRLVSWNSGIGTYRRFFAVNELAAVRQEDPRVFEATHRQLADWVAADLVDGVRVDHPDGLADPAGYLAQLRGLVGHRWLVIEKILADGEPLDATLPIDGLTGYEALTEFGGVFVDPAGEADLTELCRIRTGAACDADWLDEAELAIKRAVAQTDLAPEVRRLVGAIRAVAPTDDLPALIVATVEVLAAMPVYRADYAPLRGLLRRMIADIEERRPELLEQLSLLTRALVADGEATVRFNQVCGALTAKSVEDCLFYRTARLVSLLEVGGNPERFGISANEFHIAGADRARQWPATMTTLSTHDTKRGEDVRARITVLSEVPDLWANSVLEWENWTPSPDPFTALFLLQNMFGVWPNDRVPAADQPELRERLHAYAQKAMREADLRTSWREPDESFERSVHLWIDEVIDGRVGEALSELVDGIAAHAWANSLGQKLLQLCGPGVPDVYQGTELWEDSLVDPDNRRLVDFEERRALLGSLSSPPKVDSSGAAKMWVVAHALWVRRERQQCFVGGDYRPLLASGSAAHHALAFARAPRGGAPEVIAIASRHTVRLAEIGWGDTALELPAGTWINRLGGGTYSGSVEVGTVLEQLPIALLIRK